LGQAVWEQAGARRLATKPPVDEGQAVPRRFFRAERGAAEEAALAFWAWEGNRDRGAPNFLSLLPELAPEARPLLGLAFSQSFGARLSGREGPARVAQAQEAWDKALAAQALSPLAAGDEARFFLKDPWALESAVRAARELAGAWRPVAFVGFAPLWPADAFFGLRFTDQTIPASWPREWRFEAPLPLDAASSRKDTLVICSQSALDALLAPQPSRAGEALAPAPAAPTPSMFTRPAIQGVSFQGPAASQPKQEPQDPDAAANAQATLKALLKNAAMVAVIGPLPTAAAVSAHGAPPPESMGAALLLKSTQPATPPFPKAQFQESFELRGRDGSSLNLSIWAAQEKRFAEPDGALRPVEIQRDREAPLTREELVAVRQIAPGATEGFSDAGQGFLAEVQSAEFIPTGQSPASPGLLDWDQALGWAAWREAETLREGSRRVYAPLSPDAEGKSEALAPEAIALAFERLRARLQRSGADLRHALPDTLADGLPPLKETLTPEQRDSLLLMLRAARERAGFILADETGFGKGRSLAALMLHAVEKNQRAVFFTERRALFSDIWRDIKAVAGAEKAQALLGRLLVLHPKGRVYDADGTLAAKAPTPKVMTSWLTGENPQPLPLITLCCYSQLNRAQKSHPRLGFLRKLCTGAVLCLDEAHNAAGESNTRENIEQLITLSEFTAFSSATFAKTEAALSFYAKALPIPKKELKLLAEGFAGDGQKALASALAGALAETGRLARREHAFEGASQSQTIELSGERADTARQALGSLAEALRCLFDLMDAAQTAKAKMMGEDKESAWLKMGALLARLCRQHLLMCKIDAAADLAVASAKEGRKCVFALESTFGSFLSAVESGSAASLNRASSTDNEDDAEGSDGLSAPLAQEPVFGDLFRLAIDTACPPDAPFVIGSPQVALARERAYAAVRNLWPFLASPIDSLRETLAARGLSCGEVSGRARGLQKGEDGRWRFGPATTEPREKTVWRFNHGELDCLILTRAGSTGISLHSAQEFADTRGRDLIELEIALNPSERLQFLGRVRRRGQLAAPRYFALSSGVAFERRHLERQARKLSKLARLTSGAEASAGELDLGDELLSPAGEAAAREWLGARPVASRLLGIDLFRPHPTGEGVCERLLKRVILLDEHEQEDALSFLTRASQLEASAQERAGAGLRSLNGSLLLRRELLWGARDTERGPFEPALWLCERLERPLKRELTPDEAQAAAALGQSTSTTPERAIAWLNEAFQIVPELIIHPARGPDWGWLRGAVGQLEAGRAVQFPDPADLRPLTGWVERLHATENIEDAPFLSLWKLDVLVPELGQRLSISLARLKGQGRISAPDKSATPELLRELFERNANRPGRRRLVLEGHAAYAHWWGARMQMGRWGFFEDSFGQPRGALALPDVPGGFEGYWKFPLPLLDPEQAIAQLRLAPREPIATHWRMNRAEVLLRLTAGGFWIAIQKECLEKFDDYAVWRRFGRGRWEEINGKTYLAREADSKWLRPALASLRGKGAFFFAPPAQRDWHMRHFANIFASGAESDGSGEAKAKSARRTGAAGKGGKSASKGPPKSRGARPAVT